ncbi:Thioredoxin C-1 [Roseimaritima multifibrata]|uniref:Thioredoxin C-1 n=1 Tax=Roseimaritima multifibrata TaxID=1930274 RepID=A0A517M923_9BACT|nr:thioredoxin family protein [Roseimaritima multifibrata]QDS91390.1 Thioredoxin C-1 [Roseimaritima multifibrata]
MLTSHNKRYLVLGILAVSGLTGCANRGRIPFFSQAPEPESLETAESSPSYALSDTSESSPAAVAAAEMSMSDLESTESPKEQAPADVQVKTVSATMESKAEVASADLEKPAVVSRSMIQPTLITLPEGADLEALVAETRGPVLIDFYADWCGPCRTQGKILHSLESEAASRQGRIIKVDIEAHPKLAKRLGVKSLPTLVMIRDGEVVERKVGVTDKKTLLNWLK